MDTIQEKIDFLLSFDLKKVYDNKDFISTLSNVLYEGYKGNCTWYEGASLKLYRGRIHPDGKRFDFLKDVWYPPAEYVKYYRANTASEPLFYCANQQATVLAELKPKLNDVITLFGANIDKEKIWFKAVMDVSFYQKITLTDSQKCFEEFLVKIFKRQASVPRDYVLSALASNWITKFYPIDGLMYESMATKFHGINFAIKCTFADKYIKPFKFHCYKVVEYNSPLDFKLDCLYGAKAMTKKGKIRWMEITDCPGHLISEKIWVNK